MKCPKCRTKEICDQCGEEFVTERYGTDLGWATTKTIESQEVLCMHDNCPACKAGTCSGVHMMSCPCPKCSPRM